MTYLPGLKPVLELVSQDPSSIIKIYRSQRRQGQEMARLLELCQKLRVPLEDVPPEHLAALCGPHVAHQGVVAALHDANQLLLPQFLESASSAPLPLILALDQVKDPGNLGAICRSAWALGCGGIILPSHNAASPGPAAFKTSAGALNHLPITICSNLARTLDICEEQGFTIYGAARDQHAANAFTLQWQLPGVLVLGSEERGIRPGVLKRCQTLVAIPMARPFNSFNVAQAGAMLMALCAAQCVLSPLSANGRFSIG